METTLRNQWKVFILYINNMQLDENFQTLNSWVYDVELKKEKQTNFFNQFDLECFLKV